MSLHERSIMAISAGGSAFLDAQGSFKPEIQTFTSILQHATQKNDQTVIAVVGGGPKAREFMANIPIDQKEKRDRVGITVTWANAYLLAGILHQHGIPVDFYTPCAPLDKKCVYLCGGTTPGHTTDYVTIEAAVQAGARSVFNIANRPLLEIKNGELTDQVIPDISWNTYLRMFPENHAPGQNIPFDTLASRLAQQYNIHVYILTVNNFQKIYSGDPSAVYTSIHP